MTKIKSKAETFWRCGRQFSKAGEEFPEGTFSPEQMKILKSEPNLVVEEVEKKPEAEKQKAKAKEKEAPGEEKKKILDPTA